MSKSFQFGYAVGEHIVQRPSSILSVLTFVLGLMLADIMATFGSYAILDMLKLWAMICSLWFFPCLVILLLRLKGTAVKRKMIFQYVGKSMGLHGTIIIAIFSVAASILGDIYHQDRSSMIAFVLPVFPITLSIWMNHRFHFVLGHGENAVEEQYCAYQRERMNLFLARAKENFSLDPITPQIFEEYTCYDLVKEAATTNCIFYYDDNIYRAFHKSIEDQTAYVINENRPEAINNILRYALSDFTSADTGVAFWDNTTDIASQFSHLVVGAQGLTQTRFHAANEFLLSRKSEIEALFQYRVQMYLKDYYGIVAGLRGEKLLADALELHGDALWHREGVRLEFDDGNVSVELDSIVITKSGIFACEVKNYGREGQYRIVIEADGAWYREYPTKRVGEVPHREIMKNPYEQNDRHVAYLEKFVNEILGRTLENRVQVHNVIVLGNNQVELICDPRAEQSICRATTVYSQISRYHENVLSGEEIQKLSQALADSCKPPRAYALPDFRVEMKQLAHSYCKLYHYAADLNRKFEVCFQRYPDPDLPQ